MTDRAKFSLAGAWIILLLLLIPFISGDTSFSASVVDLLPGETVEVQILRELAEKEQGRQLNVRLSGKNGAVSPEAVKAILYNLGKSDAIAQSWIAGNKALESAGAALFENRYEWLLPEWLNRNFPEWPDDRSITQKDITERIVDQLDKSLLSPEGFALTETIPRDPFLLAAYLYEDGGLLPEVSETGDIFLWVQQSASPFSEAGQSPVFKALASALERGREIQPDLSMEYSGVSVFASASKAGIKGEIQRLNILGLIFVLLVAVFALRQFSSVIRVGIVLIISLLSATAAVISLFPSVHIIALVIGSILAGIAVDYAFHLILVEEKGLPKRSVTKAVITGSVSSALGFIVLLWAPMLFLKQVGVFVGTGLVAALLISLLLRPQSRAPLLRSRWNIRPFSLPRWTGPVILLFAVPGVFTLTWKDSINDLEYPLPELKKTEERLRLGSSVISQNKLYLAHGKNPLEARRNLEAVDSAPGASNYVHAGKWIPRYEISREAQRFFNRFPDFESRLREALEMHDYVPEAFDGFFADWDRYTERALTPEYYTGKITSFSGLLPGPMKNFIHDGDQLSWFAVLVPRENSLPALQGVIELDQSGMLTQSFSKYREAILGFAGICLLGIFLGVVIAYGFKGGLLSLAIPFASLLIAFSISGILHSGLGLFHLVGGLLSFCIGLDYAIFGVVSHRHKSPVPTSVVISLITTLGVFGILSTSQIPGIHQFALTVLLGIGSAAILIFCGWPFQKKTEHQGHEFFTRLPHGPEALMLLRARNFEKRSIEVDCQPGRFESVPGECLIEAMAQSAAVWLASSVDDITGKRMGMLVLVQNCELYQPVLESGGIYSATVESLTDSREGLLIFDGKCNDDSGTEIIRARFSILISPLEQEKEVS